MKTCVNRLKTAFILLLLALGVGAASAQDGASIKTALDAKQFVFKAETVLPTAGAMRQIGGQNYDVRVSGDSLVSYLPYFGRAYTATLGGEGGLRFTSTEFDYVVKDRRKGGWDVVLRPKDARDVREFLLTVSENGTANLRALSNNRQPISYNGTISAIK